MVDWTSPAEIAKEQRAFVTMVHVFSGLYMWEFLTHLDFEWSFITGKRQFHWPMIFYFLGRYSQLCSLVGLYVHDVLFDLTYVCSPHVNCGALFTFSQLMGQAAIGSASLNLAIRAMVLWYWKRYIVIPLVILILGHWALLMQGVQIKGVFDLQANACVQFSSGDWTLPATFIYSMCLDFTVFCLSMYQLVIVQGRRTHLLNLLFTDGLIYFGCAFLTNVPAVVFMLLKLNSETPVLSGFPVTVVSTVIACRAVRRLAKFQTGGAQVSVISFLVHSDFTSALA
ncbi:hypothetical protein K474DRAFT_1607174 [Panus rudis PR-1116 ss-1]|nr:hypothetical protein K474DRAFT_1607174 [Panus rudis PR-1116 ss-1]